MTEDTLGSGRCEHLGEGPDGLEVLKVADAAAFETWLVREHATAAGVWLAHAKRASGLTTVSYAEALDVCLCLGWIDSQSRSYDASLYLQRYTPRRARSPWSQVNRDKVAVLTEAGRMRPEGLAEVERARSDGRWDAAYAPPSRIEVPDDLRAALDADPAAAAFFATLSGANRYAVLYRVHAAKRPETRARRIAGFVQMLADGRTLH